jgi:hypothetical protein
MPEFMQDVVVTLIAIGAAYLVVSRVFSMVSPGKGQASCDSCPSDQRQGSTAAGTDGADAVKPLTLVRERRQ